MNFDPLQNTATLGAQSGIGNPFQTSPFQSQMGNPYGYGGITSQLLQNPLAYGGLQQGISQNPLLQNGLLQNPIAQQILAQQLQQAIAQQVAHHLAQQAAAQQLAVIAQQNWLYGQQGTPGTTAGMIPGQYGGNPFGQLAPQSWVGQGGQQVPGIGLLNPLTARALQSQGFAPGVNFPF
jgi:hypothetical protein